MISLYMCGSRDMAKKKKIGTHKGPISIEKRGTWRSHKYWKKMEAHEGPIVSKKHGTHEGPRSIEKMMSILLSHVSKIKFYVKRSYPQKGV